MPQRASILVLAVFVLGLDGSAGLGGQSRSQFRARLSTVPIDIAMQNDIAGSGSASAVLEGGKLVVKGAFEGLKTPVTVARIHAGPKGIRGPAILELKVTGDTRGAIEGEFTLTPQQVDDVMKGRLYIQLHSAKAPDGNLWGWLLPQAGRK